MIEGIIIINKPAGWTSQDVCAKLRSRLHIKKIGHTGTLDPMATGVLPVCIGKATRIIEYYDRDQKSYHAVMRLGVTTDTLDITGEVLTDHPCRIRGVTDEASAGEDPKDSRAAISREDILGAFAAYRGSISQLPPKYSAIKIGGRRAYDLARSGADFEMKSREITIFENHVTGIDAEKCEIGFDVTCSKGTYIRTICDDIGRTLGCGAVMTELCRTASGCFRLEDALTMEELASMSDEELASHIIPLNARSSGNTGSAGSSEGCESSGAPRAGRIASADDTLGMLGRALLYDNRVTAFLNGNSTRRGCFSITEPSRFDEFYRVYQKAQDIGASGRCGAFLGIGKLEGDALLPVKVFR